MPLIGMYCTGCQGDRFHDCRGNCACTACNPPTRSRRDAFFADNEGEERVSTMRQKLDAHGDNLTLESANFGHHWRHAEQAPG